MKTLLENLKVGHNVISVHRQSDGMTSLHLVTLKGSYDICKLLICYGAAVNTTTLYKVEYRRDDVFSALHIACQDASVGVDIVELLINRGADINLQSLSKGTTPLQFAIMCYTRYSQNELATQYSKFKMLLVQI